MPRENNVSFMGRDKKEPNFTPKTALNNKGKTTTGIQTRNSDILMCACLNSEAAAWAIMILPSSTR
jgi:hypothetical protein